MASTLAAQSPFQFNFQAVARNLAGNPLTNQSVDFQLSVLQGAMDGTAVYVEEQTATTNNFGLANLLVGAGSATLGSLSAVDWANGPFFLQIELDIQNGEGYQLMGTSALASVPYALHAKTSEQAGPEGPQGETGATGPPGAQGVSVEGVTLVEDSLSFLFSDGTSVNLGLPALPSESGSGAVQGIRVGFSASTAWTCPEGVHQIVLELWGGGGGSGSSSGFRLFSPGTSCYITAAGCSASGMGGSGGIGGAGGYMRTAVSVTPGEVYTVVVGAGGEGGQGGFGIVPNEGTAGQPGGVSAFELDGMTLVQAEGGQGGGPGTVSCCAWSPSTVYSDCPGWSQGASGSDGLQVNYTSPLSTPEGRSYIPADYMTPVSGCCASGGSVMHQAVQSSGMSYHYGFSSSNPGSCNSGGACINIFNCGSDKVEVSPYPGAAGEAGFVVISY